MKTSIYWRRAERCTSLHAFRYECVKIRATHTGDFRHVIPNKLFIADDMLKIRDENQNALTAEPKCVPFSVYDI